MSKIQNAKTYPKIYYGLHMVEGVAEYREEGHDPYRIVILENALKDMDQTFAGRPVYVQHVDNVNLDQLQIEADGYVIESFFNPVDGKHWAKFIIVSDQGHEAIRNGWQLSNSYMPKDFAGGGLWHGVEYSKEITRGEYDHLAIVPNPRYEESKILTPEEYKAYCDEKAFELKKIANSKEQGEKSMLKFFKKTKVENGADFEGMSVTLPKSGKEVAIVQLVNEADEHEMHKNDKIMCDMSHMVKMNDEEMSVGDLLKKHQDMYNELMELKKKHDDMMAEKKDDDDAEMPEDEAAEMAAKKKNEPPADDEEAKKKALELAEHEEKEIEEKKKQDEDSKAEDKKKNQKHFESIKNAPFEAIKEQPILELSEDKLERGRNRYGSGK